MINPNLGAELLNSSAREMIFQLPSGSDKHLPKFFDSLRQEKDNLGITYGISITSLEDVFLKIAQEEKQEDVQM